MAFPGGYVAKDIVLPIWSEVAYAANGHTFADAVYGGTLPIRHEAKLSIKHRSRKGVEEQYWNDMYDVLVAAELYGNSTKVLNTMYLLWRNGPNNLRIKTEKGTYFNFVDNGTNGNGSIATGNAAGSVLLSTMFTFEVGDKERSIKSNWAGGMFRAERSWMDANSGAASAGGVSGATIAGIQTLSADPTDLAPPGILGISMTDGGTTLDLGAIEGSTKLTLDFHEQGVTSPRHQGIPGWIDIKGEASLWQSDFEEMIYVFGRENKNITTTFTLPPAESETANFEIICVNSARPVEDYEGDELKNNILKVSFEGRVRGAANVVFNSAANTLTLTGMGV